jgi:hypothetical protein
MEISLGIAVEPKLVREQCWKYMPCELCIYHPHRGKHAFFSNHELENSTTTKMSKPTKS